MSPLLHLAAYRFVPLDDLERWRDRIHERAVEAGLRGTVLLAPEGVNAFVAGEPGAARGFLAWLREQPPFAGLAARETGAERLPYQRLRVRIRPEIIRMDRPAIRPAVGRAPALAPATLARWLDDGVDEAGREVVLLDTRNGFEVDHGRFHGALDWRLGRFGEFPAALEAHRDALRGKTVVSYCTGGIRCEKAALWMAEAGVEHVWQLDGGILGYFEAVGRRHFDGACFVFDEREVLDDSLGRTPAV